MSSVWRNLRVYLGELRAKSPGDEENRCDSKSEGNIELSRMTFDEPNLEGRSPVDPFLRDRIAPQSRTHDSYARPNRIAQAAA